MRYGPIVAKRFKSQYFSKRKGWATFPDWQIQPEQIHTILLELKSKEAIRAILDKSWTKRLPKESK